MCGIAGRVNFLSGRPVDPGVLRRMTDLLAHRGPDGSGVHCDGAFGFGHRRLAVIDLTEQGAQPMATDDRALWITFNGEVYNFQDLRRDLEARGHVFRSHTDTEVVLHAYREYGPECLAHFVGMFAFAIWDAGRRELFLARDRVGKKPLHYRLDGDGLSFASEPKAFLAEPGFTPQPDPHAISRYLSLQYVPAPMSAFRGVAKLPPGHYLRVRDGQVEIERYWRLHYAPTASMNEDEAAEALRAHLVDAVRARLVSDVPLGAFLSGGIDSATVVALMAQSGEGRVKTFSIGFEDEQFNELPLARLVAQRYGTDHHEFIVRPEALDVLPKIVWHYNEPYADSSAVPTWYVSEVTRRHVTVALNGDGGDESFAGYDRYIANIVASKADLVPRVLRRALGRASVVIPASTHGGVLSKARRFLEVIAETPRRRYATWMFHFRPSMKRDLCTDEFLAEAQEDVLDWYDGLFAASDAPDFLGQTLDADVNAYLPEDLLVKVDIASMAHSLEARSPLLDHRLMEFAARLPSSMKIRRGEKKYLLRKVIRDMVPPEILTQPKRGFAVPLQRWFREDLRDLAQDVLLGARFRQRGYFKPEAVARLVQEHVSGVHGWHFQIWNLLMLELWHRTFIDGDRAVHPSPVGPEVSHP